MVFTSFGVALLSVVLCNGGNEVVKIATAVKILWLFSNQLQASYDMSMGLDVTGGSQPWEHLRPSW
jgi:hypothetical protein